MDPNHPTSLQSSETSQKPLERQCRCSLPNLVLPLTGNLIARNQSLKRRHRVTPGSWSKDARRMGTVHCGDVQCCQMTVGRCSLMSWSFTSSYHYCSFNSPPTYANSLDNHPLPIYACSLQCSPPMRNTESHRFRLNAHFNLSSPVIMSPSLCLCILPTTKFIINIKLINQNLLENVQSPILL